MQTSQAGGSQSKLVVDNVDFQSEIVQLSGCLTLVREMAMNLKMGCGKSPYDFFFQKERMLELRQAFEREYCRVNSISTQSALLQTVEAGTYAIPKLAKVRRIIKEHYKKSRELPCEVNLGSKFKFHNIFVCPVSKEQGVPNNAPQLLSCGHVISK